MYNIFIALIFLIAIAALIVGSIALHRDRRDTIITISENNSNNLSSGVFYRPVVRFKEVKISPRNIIETTNDNGIINNSSNLGKNSWIGQSIKEIKFDSSIAIIYNNSSLAGTGGKTTLKIENNPNDRSIFLIDIGVSRPEVELFGISPGVSIGISSGISIVTLTYS